MKNFHLYILIIIGILSSSIYCFGQEGPAGVLGLTENRFWFATSFDNISNNTTISTWNNRGGNTLNAVAVNAIGSPIFKNNTTDNINGYPVIQFDGIDDLLAIADNSDLNTSQVSKRSMYFTIRTGTDVTNRQYIYQEGGSTRGIGLYIFNGELYLGAWNLNNDGAGSPWGFSFTKTIIDPNTTYNIGFIFDGNNTTTGQISLSVDNALVGVINNIGLLYGHNNDISLGACKNNTVTENGAFSGNGLYFSGDIAEVIFFKQVINSAQQNLIFNYLSAKYNIPLAVGNDYLMDIPSNGDFDHEMFGIQRITSSELHTNASGTDVCGISNADDLDDGEFLMIGNNKGQIIEDLLPVPSNIDFRLERVWRVSEGGDVGNTTFTFDLAGITTSGNSINDYFLLIDLIDDNFSDATIVNASSYNNNEITFNGVNIPDGAYLSLGINSGTIGNTGVGGVYDNDNIKFWFDASDLLSFTADNSPVQNWFNQGGGGLNASQNVTANRPTFQSDASNTLNGHPVLSFDGTNDFFNISNTIEINLNPKLFGRSLSLTIATNNDVTSRQVLYEEGGGVRGINLYIFGGQLYFAAWNLANDGQGAPWSFKFIRTPISANTAYVLTAIFQGNQSITGTLELYVNGQLAGQATDVGFMYSHSGGIRIGSRGDTYFETGTVSGSGNFFNGHIAEFILYNTAVPEVRRQIIENALSAKYNIPLIDNDRYTRDNVSDGNYDYDMAGIGRLGSFSHTDAKGEGPIRGFNANNLDVSDFFLWGHDSAVICANNSDVPTGVENRLNRIWRVSEQGEVGDMSFQIDISIFGLTDPAQVRLLVDNNLVFNNANVHSPSSTFGTIAQFDNVNIDDGNYFTLGSSEIIYDNDIVSVWTGAVSSNWSTNANWTGGLPNSKRSALIPSGLTTYPVLSLNAFCKNLTIEPGATLTASASQFLVIGGSFINKGTYIPATSTVRLDESCSEAQVSFESPQSLYNLEINNTQDINIIGAEVSIINALRLNNGNLNTNDSLKLISDANRTARIAPITNGSISGTIINQRYIDAGATNWRYLTFPVSGASLEQFDDDFITSGIPGTDFPNWPSPSNPWPSFYFYDENVGTTFNDGFVVPNSTSEIVSPGQGVWIWCGDTITGTQPFTIDVRGPANTGNINLPVSYNITSGNLEDDGWNMVANPYPCTIDWLDPDWNKTNIDDAIYIWNPDLQQYASYVAGVGVNGGSNLIASSQAFMVHANTNNPVLTITENCKIDQDQGFLKAATISQDLLRIKVNDGTHTDETVIRFDPSVTHTFDTWSDAQKNLTTLTNTPKLYTHISGENYAINSLNSDSLNYSLPLHFKASYSGNHTLKITDRSALSPMHCVLIEDTQNGTFINIKNDTIYNFNSSVGDPVNRFIIHFSISHTFNKIDPSCFGQNDGQIIIDDILNNSNYSVSSNTFNTAGTAVSGLIFIDSLNSGLHNISITHTSGACPSYTEQVILVDPLQIQTSSSNIPSSCSTCCDASSSIQISQGFAPYTIHWDDPSISGFNPSGLCSGIYDYTIEDANGCSIRGQSDLTGINSVGTQNSNFDVYPNPSDGNFVIVGDYIGKAYVYNSRGKLILQTVVENSPTRINLSSESSGLYLLQLGQHMIKIIVK